MYSKACFNYSNMIIQRYIHVFMIVALLDLISNIALSVIQWRILHLTGERSESIIGQNLSRKLHENGKKILQCYH